MVKIFVFWHLKPVLSKYFNLLNFLIEMLLVGVIKKNIVSEIVGT